MYIISRVLRKIRAQDVGLFLQIADLFFFLKQFFLETLEKIRLNLIL